MINKFDNLSVEQTNLVVLKVLSILEEKKYSQLVNWPFEDISLDDLFYQLKNIYSSSILKGEFIKFFLEKINKKKQYSVIEGIFNLIRVFEDLERYEDCIILKDIEDNILLDLQYSRV